VSRVGSLTRALWEHDKDLFARKDGYIVNIYRKNKRFFRGAVNESNFYVLQDSPDYVFSLTDTWTHKGIPIEWGIEVVLARVKAMDIWNHDTLFKEMEVENEKVDASTRRNFRNNLEGFLGDFRSQFAKATNDINTGTLNKKELRNGYCK